MLLNFGTCAGYYENSRQEYILLRDNYPVTQMDSEKIQILVEKPSIGCSNDGANSDLRRAPLRHYFENWRQRYCAAGF